MKTSFLLSSGARGGRWLPWLWGLLGAGSLWAGGAPSHHPPASAPPEVTLGIASEGPYVAPEDLLLSARVSDPDGWVVRVEFLADDHVIGVAEGDSRSMGPLTPFRFQWRGVLAGDYLLQARAFDNTGVRTLSKPVKLHVEQAERAFIVIRQPEPGATFTAPGRVKITAVAVDPEADIRRVIFYANDKKLGVSELWIKMAIIPGNPMRHQWVWENAPAGEYRIRAEAEDLHGNLVRSEPVPIVVAPAAPLARVTIEAAESHAREGADGADGELWFLIQRDGSLDVDMPVYYRLGGSATAGEDYAELPGAITIPAGEEAVELKVRSLPDDVPEGEEGVVVTIVPPACPEIFPPPPFCYLPGHPAQARGVIVDDGAPPPPEPLVLVPAGAVWSYWNEDAPPAGGWKDLDYSEEGWKSGPAQLGYGDGDEATVTRDAGPPHPMTAYFRTRFDAPADLSVPALRVRLVRDDGAAVYLNGVELLRSNLPDGPLDFETPANGPAGRPENRWHRFDVPADALVPGANILAVEVHQYRPTSSDLSFDLELTALAEPLPPERPVVRLEAVVPETSEPSPDTKVAPGVFRLTRTGPVDDPLQVVCLLTGSADPEADYQLDPALGLLDWGAEAERIPGGGPVGAFVIPAGSESLEIRVLPLDDALPEQTESVILKVLATPFGAWEPGGFPEFAPPYLVDPEQSRARVLIHDNDVPAAAELVIHHPADGATFPPGTPVPVNILAVDPHGYIARVEVFADDELIGVSEIAFVRPPEPGEPVEHEILWEHPQPGAHALVARAVTPDGVKVESAPVRITVKPDASDRVVLAITAPHPRISEPAPDEDAPPAFFVVRRVSGPLEVELPVYLELTGTADNGEDYVKIGPDFVLPAGAKTLEIPIVPLPDDLKEGRETVIARLLPPACIAIVPPPPGCYLVGRPDTAQITIQDTPPTGNLPPQVAIVRPRHGAVLPLGEPVTIVARAHDPDGDVVRVQLWLNHEELASGAGDHLEAEWTPESPGRYTFRAGATDNDGAERTSRRVTVFVREGTGLAFARRELPAAYVPGEPLSVSVVVQPPDYGAAWAIEDRPPEGWQVSDVFDDGVFDPATGKVKFGPFMEHEPRTLVYQVTPPRDAAGPQHFVGHASVDGEQFRLGGDQVLRPANDRHPADRSPADMTLTMNEVTAYTAAWKTGQEWPEGPIPVPLSYVTRAGALWKGGEVYAYEPDAGAPPACWVNVPPPAEPGAGLADRGLGHAERELPPGCRPGAALATKVTIRPPAGTLAWAVEEVVPRGWRVTDISDDGQFDAEQRRIRWGLFFGDEPAELSYRAIAPNGVTSVAHFLGWVSFDGHVQPLGGRHEAVAADEDTVVRFTGVEHRHDGGVRLRLRGAPGQLVVVEASDDLVHWHEVAPVGLVDGELLFEDPDTGAPGPRFYRARPIGP